MAELLSLLLDLTQAPFPGKPGAWVGFPAGAACSDPFSLTPLPCSNQPGCRTLIPSDSSLQEKEIVTNFTRLS